jgi:YD repeat-containing protein
MRDADDQLVRITDADGSEEWVNRHRIIRVTRMD